MSTYVKEKVLRIPVERVDMSYIKSVLAEKYPNEDHEDDFSFYLEQALPDLLIMQRQESFRPLPQKDRSLIMFLNMNMMLMENTEKQEH